MIWVRSQDKEQLVETSNFSIADKTRNNVFGDVLEVIGYTIDCDLLDTTIELGEYSTKEKALKVMDMIQEEISHIQCLYPAGGYNPILVKKAFQMPQDDEVTA